MTAVRLPTVPFALLLLCGLTISPAYAADGPPDDPSVAAATSGSDEANPAAAERPSRPNILFAFADDWGRYASAYAALEGDARNDLSRATGFSTPNFDAIAGAGVLFTHAYVNAPSCTPCRSSLLTGRPFYTTGLGAILRGAKWDGSIPSYPEALEADGYRIGYTYKVWSPGQPIDAPFGGRQKGFRSAGSDFNRFSQNVSAADAPDARAEELFGQVRDNFRAFLDDESGNDESGNDESGEDGASEGEEKPWHYWFGPTNVHRTWTKGSGQALWGIEPDSLKGKMPPFLPDVPEVREDFADYLGEVMAFDAALGVLLDELKERGELANTVVVVSGDHGAPGFPRGKTNLYDFGVAVPLAIAGPGVLAGPDGEGRVVTDFVTLPDLAPTFLDMAGVDRPVGMSARSLTPILISNEAGRVDEARDASFFGRERHVAVARDDYLPYPMRGIRTDDYLYIRNFAPDRWPEGTGPGYGEPGEMPSAEALTNTTRAAFGDVDAGPTKAYVVTNRDSGSAETSFELGFLKRPAEELYDVKTDPHQMTNLADDPAHAEAKQELSERLMRHLKKYDDPRVTGDGSTFDESPYADPAGYERLPDGGVRRTNGR